MNFQQLYCFCATAEQLNFTRAAKHLYIGQPTLSKHISDLEQELGVKLFIRNNRTVKLTDAGMIFLKHANEIIVKITETLEATRQAGSGLVGTLRIGIIDIEKYFLTHLISKYHRIYPNNHISINRYSWIAINEALNHDEVDLAFTFVHGLEMLAGVTWEKLATVPITVILPLSHPLAKKKKIDLTVCANESFIAVKSALATSIITQLCLK
jgi:DNA-binding transcriptional LysR family regulator